MNIEGPYLGQLDASFSARRHHLGATPEESATRCSTGRAQVARFCRRSVVGAVPAPVSGVEQAPHAAHTIVVGTPIVALAHRQLLPPLAGALDLAVPPSAMP
jgi:hypothetical protein